MRSACRTHCMVPPKGRGISVLFLTKMEEKTHVDICVWSEVAWECSSNLQIVNEFRDNMKTILKQGLHLCWKYLTIKMYDNVSSKWTSWEIVVRIMFRCPHLGNIVVQHLHRLIFPKKF